MISIIQGPLVNVRFIVQIYDAHPPTIMGVSAFINIYHVPLFFPGTDSPVVLDKENLSIKSIEGVHLSIPKNLWCHWK